MSKKIFSVLVLLSLAVTTIPGQASDKTVSASSAQATKPEPIIFPGSKMAIETPLKKVLSEETSAFELYKKPTVRAESAQSKPSKLEPVLAKAAAKTRVSAGLVSWHSNFEQACRKAEQSGKAVLLFQLLGDLDDEFC